MLLRSSSTPILGSLLSSSSSASSTPHFNESPTHRHHNQIVERSPSRPQPPKPSLRCQRSPHPNRSPTHDPSFSSSSPSSIGLRRAQSDGNLHGLLPPEPRTRSGPALGSIPSFSTNSNHKRDEEVDDDGDVDDGEEKGLFDGGFSFVGQNQDLSLVENGGGYQSFGAPLFLARGLGIDRVGSGLLDVGGNFGGGGGGGCAAGGAGNGNGGERSDIELHYRKMVEENPSNALFLSNYAQFLYKSKGDAQRAEEYYSRAILAEPGDGQILSQYAKLVWELHHDKERASSYFEQALQASPNDSNVLGLYASFVWETEEDDEYEGHGESQECFGSPVQHEIFA